jgi:hypothetical protein
VPAPPASTVADLQRQQQLDRIIAFLVVIILGLLARRFLTPADGIA